MNVFKELFKHFHETQNKVGLSHVIYDVSDVSPDLYWDLEEDKEI